MAGEQPKTAPEAKDVTQKTEAEITALKALIEQKDKVVVDAKTLPETPENKVQIAEALTASNAAKAKIAILQKQLIEQKAGVSAKAAEATTAVAKSAEAALTAPVGASQAVEAAKQTATATPVVEAVPAVAATVAATPAVAEAAKAKPDIFQNIFKSDKVLGWLSKYPGFRQVLEMIGPIFGINIDWAAQDAKRLAEGSQAKLNDDELKALKEISNKPQLALAEAEKGAIDPKDENVAWKHIGKLLKIPAVTSQADFYAIVGGQRQVDLGSDKGGMQKVPDFNSMGEAPNGGYKAGDVLVYTNKQGDRIPAVVTDASQPDSPIISFVNKNGILPVGKKFDEIKDLQYLVTGNFNDPSVKLGLKDYSLSNVLRVASLADQQAWYENKNPKKEETPVTQSAPVVAPTVTAAAPAATPQAAPVATPPITPPPATPEVKTS